MDGVCVWLCVSVCIQVSYILIMPNNFRIFYVVFWILKSVHCSLFFSLFFKSFVLFFSLSLSHAHSLSLSTFNLPHNMFMSVWCELEHPFSTFTRATVIRKIISPTRKFHCNQITDIYHIRTYIRKRIPDSFVRIKCGRECVASTWACVCM